jgi:hypothetical protein
VRIQSTSAQDLSDLLSAAESAATIVALVVGGVWAYFKFIKGRVYRPRLQVTIETDTLLLKDQAYLVCSLSLKNIGSSKIMLVQQGSGLRVSSMKGPVKAFSEPDWVHETVHDVFQHHEWIESSEAITHEFLFPVDVSKGVLLLEARLVCKRRRTNLSIYGRRIATLPMQWNEEHGKEADDGDPSRT